MASFVALTTMSAAARPAPSTRPLLGELQRAGHDLAHAARRAEVGLVVADRADRHDALEPLVPRAGVHRLVAAAAGPGDADLLACPPRAASRGNRRPACSRRPAGPRAAVPSGRSVAAVISPWYSPSFVPMPRSPAPKASTHSTTKPSFAAPMQRDCTTGSCFAPVQWPWTIRIAGACFFVRRRGRRGSRSSGRRAASGR